MKNKTIKRIIRKKLDDVVESIKDENIQMLFRKNVIVTGGAIASMLLNEEVNDYDLYFKTKEAALEITKYFFKRAYSVKGEELIEEDEVFYDEETDRVKIHIKSRGLWKGFPSKLQKYHPCFMSSNAITLSGDVQIICRFYGSPEEIHSNYDFIHCTNYYTYFDNRLVLNLEALTALLNRDLVYVGSKYPICSMMRTRKFLKRGFTCSADNYVKMAFHIKSLDLYDIDILEDQLMGVDSTYFAMLIREVRDQGLDQKLNPSEYQNYIFEKLDEVFNDVSEVVNDEL